MISGLHHVTAIASDPQQNYDFYARFLGLRLVKKTINFDDPGTYHFYFGDQVGAPGTIMTFFLWPGAYRGRIGTGQTSVTSFAVPRESLAYWTERARSFGVELQGTTSRFDSELLSLSDPDGLRIELVAGDVESDTVSDGGGVPADHAIRGFHSVTLSEAQMPRSAASNESRNSADVPRGARELARFGFCASSAEEGFERTAALLTGTLGFHRGPEDGNRFRFETGSGGPGSIVDLLCLPSSQRGRQGAGTVHHIAWRTPDDASQNEWRAKLASGGLNVTPVMDRNYFKSIYFREPGGVLFEIATDPPGFAIDEPAESLGSALKLPAWYEPARAQIEAALPPLRTEAAA
jgi:glyoxalase family protein